MQNIHALAKDIYWIGANDRRLHLFENIFPVPRGISYNSYVILDEKTVLLDTVDNAVSEPFFLKLNEVLNGRKLDYLIVNHMEPDHGAMIARLMEYFPQLQIIGNAKTFQFIEQFFHMKVDGRAIVVKENDTIQTGAHTLRFITAPMVHWPEVMVTYDETEKILFSADAFGTFGALPGNIFSDELNFERDWIDDARRYYANIVGKYGAMVKTLLKKTSSLDIQIIAPLHGPIWRGNLAYILDKYSKWSSYEPEEKAVVIIYGSMYGHTEAAAETLAGRLADKGIKNIAVYDVSGTHVSNLIAEVFRASHLVLAAPTYNGAVYPPMDNFLNDMKAINVSSRTAALIENGTWAPTAAGQMKTKLLELKDITVLEDAITIRSELKPEQESQLERLADRIYADLTDNRNSDIK